ncbi:MAG: hypothetical protein LQ342_002779 [Letrouitia transgressa]|nr:MAG: hypothetical protein LQ342_002779 [Letrouitia transgressa]
MQSRYLVISFYRVWGVERVSTRLKARIEFPANYPNDMPAIMSLMSTTGLPDEAVVQIMTEAPIIADAYKDRKKSSLETILRYSLGEQTLAESLSLLKARPDNQTIDADIEPDFSSSDEDDDGSGKVIGIQAQGLDMSDSTIAISNAQYSVPLPKACGAYWADDGRLVCFFPSKQDKSSSLLGSLALKPGEGYPRNYQSVFEGLSRLNAGSILAKTPSSNLDTVKSDDSDHEDFSTSSESSSENELGVPELHLMPPIASRGEKSDQHHTMSIDDSQRSSGQNAKGLSTGGRLRNFVSIHNFADILPSKQTLANEYVLDDELSKCCKRNAETARAHGESDLADVWSLIYLILRNEVPTKIMQMPRKNSSIVIAARRAIGPLKGEDSGIDMSSDFVAEENKTKIQWGYHPFGRQWLVKSL